MACEIHPQDGASTPPRVEHQHLPEDVATVLTMFERSEALIGVYDETETLRFTNAAFRAAYFVPENQPYDWQTLMRTNFAAGRGTKISTDDIDAWIASVRSRRGKLKKRTYESDLHDGRFIWVVETMLPNGWIMYVGTDVTELKPSERMLRLARDEAVREATTDPLTGVSNRRHILAQLDQVLAEDAGALSTGGSACLLDIDHFKRINDTFGHHEGDATLIAIARASRDTIDLRDAFGRVGGEEFLLLFPGKDLDVAEALMQRLRDKVKSLRPISTAPEYQISFSGGVTALVPGEESNAVLARCDRALYDAKKGGRDRVLRG